MAVKPWVGAFPPFRIFGNLYFVGTEPASTHIVDTGDGLIMFDSGYQHSLYLVIDGMHRLGLDPHDPEIFDTYTMDGTEYIVRKSVISKFLPKGEGTYLDYLTAAWRPNL